MLLSLLQSELCAIFHLLAPALLVFSINVPDYEKGLHDQGIVGVFLHSWIFWSNQWGFTLAEFMCLDYPACEHKTHRSEAVIHWPSRSVHQTLGKAAPTGWKLQVFHKTKSLSPCPRNTCNLASIKNPMHCLKQAERAGETASKQFVANQLPSTLAGSIYYIRIG